MGNEFTGRIRVTMIKEIIHRQNTTLNQMEKA